MRSHLGRRLKTPIDYRRIRRLRRVADHPARLGEDDLLAQVDIQVMLRIRYRIPHLASFTVYRSDGRK
jgi:hypothetical protein